MGTTVSLKVIFNLSIIFSRNIFDTLVYMSENGYRIVIVSKIYRLALSKANDDVPKCLVCPQPKDIQPAVIEEDTK